MKPKKRSDYDRIHKILAAAARQMGREKLSAVELPDVLADLCAASAYALAGVRGVRTMIHRMSSICDDWAEGRGNPPGPPVHRN